MQVYDVGKTKLLYSGDSRLAATSEAQSLPTIDAESTQMWNQYHIAQQHDATDGSQIGHPQLNGNLVCV